MAETHRGGRKLSTGIIVDHVSEVLEVPAENIEPPPSLGNSMDSDFIVGMGKVGDKVVMLLDIDKVGESASWRTLTPPLGLSGPWTRGTPQGAERQLRAIHPGNDPAMAAGLRKGKVMNTS